MTNSEIKERVEKAYNSLTELSKVNGDAAIARRELYYLMNDLTSTQEMINKLRRDNELLVAEIKVLKK